MTRTLQCCLEAVSLRKRIELIKKGTDFLAHCRNLVVATNFSHQLGGF